ncbi:MAG: hypothetical protein C4317_00320 [Acidimicrobiia bacterium]
MPLTPAGRLSALIVGNRTIRRVLGFDLPERDVRWAGVRRGMRVLELGAGRGLYTQALEKAVRPDGTVVAIEYSEEAARLLHKDVPAARVVVGDATKLPISERSRFDAICFFYSIEEIPEAEIVLRQASRLVAPGGMIILHLWRPLSPKRKRSSIVGVLRSERFQIEARWSDFQNVRMVLKRQ